MTKRVYMYMFFSLALIGLLFNIQNAYSAEGRYLISEQTTITEPGAYLVTNNIVSPGGPVITIQAENVTLDLGGFTLSSGPDDVATIQIDVASSVKIFNGTIRTYNRAINAMSLYNAQLEFRGLKILYYAGGNYTQNGIEVSASQTEPAHVRIEDCVFLGVGVGTGIFMDSVEGIIRSNKISGFTTGILISNSDQIIVESDVVFRNVNGIELGNANRVIVRGNNISKNTNNGVVFTSCNLGMLIGNNISDNANAGIEMADSSYNTVMRNTLSFTNNTGGYGIKADSFSNYNNFKDNTIACDLTDNGLVLNGTGNIYRDNTLPGQCKIIDASGNNIDGGGNIG